MAQIDHKERITYLLETIVKHLERAKAIASGTERASIFEFEKSFSLAYNWSQELALYSEKEKVELPNRINLAISSVEEAYCFLRGEATKSHVISLSSIEGVILLYAISDFRSELKS
jgi:hypothetical protein